MKVFGVSLITIIVVGVVWYVARKTNLFKGTLPAVTG